MATGDREYLKELCRLSRAIDKLTCGQARLDLNCDQDRTFYLYITPDDGYYKGATCKFKVCVPATYPSQAPHVTCMNSIYHPNIDIDSPESALCVNLLENDWQPEIALDGCVMAVLFLLHNPNLEDALSPVFDGSSMDVQAFANNVKTSLRGGVVEGVQFDQLINDLEEDLVVNIRISENVNKDDDEMFKDGDGRRNEPETDGENKHDTGGKTKKDFSLLK